MVPRVNKPHGQACYVVHSLPYSHTAAAGLTKFHSNLPMKEKEKEIEYIIWISYHQELYVSITSITC